MGFPKRAQLTSFTWRFVMKKLSPKQVLAVRCPTCGAKPGEKCELSTGLPRNSPHRDRRLDAIEPDGGTGGGSSS
jgi:hypothetical protein